MNKVKKVFSGLGKVISKPFKLITSGYNSKTAAQKGKIKATAFKTVAGIATGAIILSACQKSDDEKKETPTFPDNSISTLTEDDDVKEDTTNNFISDDLNGADITIEDTIEEVTDEEEFANGYVDENGNDISNIIAGNGTIIEDVTYSDDVIIDSNGDAIINNTGQGNVDNSSIDNNGNYYVSPDGAYWDSEETYKEYINSLNGNTNNNTNSDSSTTEKEDSGFYIDSDNVVWENKEEYDKYVNNDFTMDLYVAPDGSLWDTEDAYISYLEGFKTIVDTPSNDEPVQDENEYYVSPDGEHWDSEEEYQESLKQDDTNTNSYYVAPDGSVWASASDYNEYINSITVEAPKEEVVTPNEEVVTPNEDVTEDQLGQGANEPEFNYYVAPDNSVWVSYEDYIMYNQQENVNEKTR